MTKLLLLAMVAVQPAREECPVFVTASGHPPAVAAQTRPYTDCMVAPDFPTEDQLNERRQRCAELRERQVALAVAALQRESSNRLRRAARLRADAERPFRWIDHIASTLPGCETDVRIEGDGSERFNAED